MESNPRIEGVLKNFFASRRNALIYGAGNQGSLVAERCHFFKKPVAGFLLSPGGKRKLVPGLMTDIPDYLVTEFPRNLNKSDYDVIISVREKHNDAIRDLLRQNEFDNVYSVDSWLKQNAALTTFWYEKYFEFRGARMRWTGDGGGERYIEYPFGDGHVWRVYFPEDDSVAMANICGAMSDLVFPSIFDDYKYIINEGPRETGDVALRKNDIVFDLGANVGLFSTVAAAKQCRVYSFEPTPMTQEILKKNLSLYDEGQCTLEPFAVTDKKGHVDFYINSDFNNDESLTSNSLHGASLRPDGMEKIRVDTISIDEFVEENGISRVDFIKANIEGAERLMLKGAKRTLARFAPKLYLSNCHLPDDPEVLRALIAEANPDYIIEEKWLGTFAHCPPKQ